jgi:hypothetical protein
MVTMVGLAGCGDDGGDANPDARRFDALDIQRSDRAYVVKRFVLPATMEDVDAGKFTFPGSNEIPVNKLGAITQVLIDLLEGLPVQQGIDDNFAAGQALQVIVINSGDPTGYDDGVTGQFALAEDTDGDASNNFSGTAELRIAAGEALDTKWVMGTLDAGELRATGTGMIDVTIQIPIFDGEAPLEVPGMYGQLRSTMTEDSLNGHAASAILPQEIYDHVYPVSARLLTQAIQMELPRADDIRGLFDANNDDEVTVQELIDNPTLASLTLPDVDTDGDGEPDRISQSIRAEAVRVTLVD